METYDALKRTTDTGTDNKVSGAESARTTENIVRVDSSTESKDTTTDNRFTVTNLSTPSIPNLHTDSNSLVSILVDSEGIAPVLYNVGNLSAPLTYSSETIFTPIS